MNDLDYLDCILDCPLSLCPNVVAGSA